MSNEQQLVDRVRNTLQRLGYFEIQVEHLGAGKIRLAGKVDSYDERAIVVASVRTVNGVTSVSLKLSV